ncbi:acyl-CoA synthetase [Zavarzinia compransoris]|uniref:Acyl-CoA synthetase n=1 Tax=Zavarzinia compransoris TaxID=1264899 RepID=A0A317E6J7_9PROT|nr:acyl-CoA synthetase [Zavarzinia compransoris]PWR21914.1 acyl-CoA synthetase [Zavarzinia compransoris]TDP47353.1 fatty-acyl-CoA synthase [Zavarzinia compransoris]
MDEVLRIATYDDVLAIEAVPLRDRLHGLTDTYGVIERAARLWPDEWALRFLLIGDPELPSHDVSYRDLLARVTAAANLFQRLGIGPGRAVGLLLPNAPETHYALWGAQAAGIASPVNPLLEPGKIADILRNAGATVLVTLAPFPQSDLWDKAVEVIDQVPGLTTVLRVDLSPYVPEAMRPMLAALTPPDRWPARADVDILDFGAALAGEAGDRLVSGRVIGEGEVAAYFHTGGTTGTPKLARQTHANQVFEACILGSLMGAREDRVLLCGLPLFHVNGTMVTGLAAFASGRTVVLLTPQGYRGQGVVANFWALVERFRGNSFSGVPTLYAALLDVPIAGRDVSSLRSAICGAAPMPADLIRRFEQATGVKILEGYGMTEGTCASAMNPRWGERRTGSVGFRLPYVELQPMVLDERGRPSHACAVGEVGALCMKGPQLFAGYAGQPAPDGWFDTGDLARYDGDHYLWLVGRSKDLIIRGGHNIDPQMIEDVLAAHPAVALAAAIGQPDAYAGELPAAYVALRPGAAASAEDLITYARAHVPERAAAPVHLEILPELPVTAVGKIHKPPLRQRAAARVLGDALRAAGVAATVETREDATRGLLAVITPVPGTTADEIREVVGGFAVATEIAESRAAAT